MSAVFLYVNYLDKREMGRVRPTRIPGDDERHISVEAVIPMAVCTIDVGDEGHYQRRSGEKYDSGRSN
jgi:hypothetical protein